MFGLKDAYFYFVALRISFIKFFKKIYFTSRHYNKSLRSKIPLQVFFNQNPFFLNWPNGTSKHFLLDYILPTEDIDIINTLNQNIENLENYNYSNIIDKSKELCLAL